jgi:hypothetical protein
MRSVERTAGRGERSGKSIGRRMREERIEGGREDREEVLHEPQARWKLINTVRVLAALGCQTWWA